MTKAELERKKKLLEQKAELEYKIMLAEAKDNYASYVELVHNGQYRHGKHTRLICEKLQLIHEGKLKRLAIFMPPRHSKSQSVTETFPSWYIGNNPDRRVIQVSYGDDLAVDFGLKNRQKVEEYGKMLFGVEIDADKQAKGDWAIKGKQGYMRSGGILSPISGKGCNLLIIDDPIKNSEEAESENIRNRIDHEYESTLLTRLTPDGAIILIMTPWHEADIHAKIKFEKGWEVINLPCEAEENDLLGREIGEPLWPEFGFNEVWIEDMKKRIGSRAWNALYQLRPSSAGGNLLKRSWWKYYNVLPQMATKLISVDATFKDKETSDFVSIQVWGKTGANMYLIDKVKARMDFPTTLQAILNMKAKHKDSTQILIEDKANGSAIIQVLQTKVGGIIAVEPQGGKVARVNAISPQIEAGNVYIPQNEEWVQDFVEECAAFPNGKHDDDVDAMSQALARMIYMPAMLPAGAEKYDSFLHGPKPENPFECGISQSFIEYGT
jgi:predicted phage terminase large subunit-like protein